MKYQGYLIDLDGTIYLGKEIIPAGKRFVEKLQQEQIPHLFVTNNTTKSPVEVAERLYSEFQLKVAAEEIYTASLATVDFIKKTGEGHRIFAIGEGGLIDLLLASDLTWDEENPDYVIVGMDRELTYEKLEIATLAIRKGAKFIGTNPDKNLPTERGLIPGAGSINALLATATNTQPQYIGKPNKIIMDNAVKKIGLNKEEVLMVGDNYETDIQAGIANNIDTLLVLSGFTTRESLSAVVEQPTYVLNNLDEWKWI